MNPKQVIVSVILAASVAGGAWWFFHEYPEAEVRDAHREFARLLSKPEGEPSGALLFNARVLQTMFAETCEVSGEAERFGGSYTPEELAGLIMQVRGMFRSVDLTFHDLVIEFPAADEATGSFSARMIVRGRTEETAEAFDTRDVVSRMRKLDGDWRFVSFNLLTVPENG